MSIAKSPNHQITKSPNHQITKSLVAPLPRPLRLAEASHARDAGKTVGAKVAGHGNRKVALRRLGDELELQRTANHRSVHRDLATGTAQDAGDSFTVLLQGRRDRELDPTSEAN